MEPRSHPVHTRQRVTAIRWAKSQGLNSLPSFLCLQSNYPISRFYDGDNWFWWILYLTNHRCNIQELRERVLRGKYRIPFYMSTDCENLLKKFLVLNPLKRSTLDVRSSDAEPIGLNIICASRWQSLSLNEDIFLLLCILYKQSHFHENELTLFSNATKINKSACLALDYNTFC